MSERDPFELLISRLHSTTTYTSREIEEIHENYNFELSYLRLVRQGDTEGLAKLFRVSPNIDIGIVADTPLRQTKNIFIVSVTTATRASIEGGVPPVEAYKLSDIYILQMEKMTSTDEILKLQFAMLFDFTRRVAQWKLPAHTSAHVLRCARYIASHVNEPLTVKSVAACMGLSRPYLSKLFSAELGFPMSDYIMRRKLEEAKNLLRYSDKSIGEISGYLCFSSQSYFQNVFKKKCGISPNEYRKEKSVPRIFNNSQDAL